MNQIEVCTGQLIRAIQESKEYQRFCRVRDEVKKDPELHSRINAFRRHVYEVQNSREPLDMYGEMERITRDYEEFRREPLVEEFLESELRVCRMIQKITVDVTRAVDLDTEQVADGIEL